MPYTARKDSSCPPDKPWAVIKKSDGSKAGCHASEESAYRQIAAIEANEGKEVKEKDCYVYVPSGVTSFDELENVAESIKTQVNIEMLTAQYNKLVNNVMFSETQDKTSALRQLNDEFINRLNDDPEPVTLKSTLLSLFGLKQKQYKRENGLDFPAEDYAYVPDPKRPATWKVRLTEAPGRITVQQLVMAAKSLRPGEKAAQIPLKARTAVKRRIRQEFRKKGIAEEKIPMVVRKSFSVTKGEDGVYRWIGIYSNKFRDDDNPPEIISEKSHKTFEALVKEGIVPPPELWVWHIPGSRIGVAKTVGYTDGFAWAVGVFDPGKEHIAKALQKEENRDLNMSHGMPSEWIRRDESDSSIITRHITREVSILPYNPAANKLTGFTSKETDMLSEEKKTQLRALGFDDDEIVNLSEGIKSLSRQAEGLESKEADQEENVEATTEIKDEEVSEQEETIEENPGDKAVTVSEFSGVMKEIVTPLMDAIKAQGERIDLLTNEVTSLRKSDQERMVKTVENTPQMSLADQMKKELFGDADRVKEGDKLSTQQPKQASFSPSFTGVPMLDNLMNGQK